MDATNSLGPYGAQLGAAHSQRRFGQNDAGAFPGVGVECQEPPQPAMDAINSRISMLIGILQDAYHPLIECGDRLLGGIPRGVSGDPSAKPSGVVGETLARLDSIISLAAQVRDEARRLNGGI